MNIHFRFSQIGGFKSELQFLILQIYPGTDTKSDYMIDINMLLIWY